MSSTPSVSGAHPAPLKPLPWQDILHRRIAMQACRLGGLSLSPDGRIAISAGTRVSVLHATTAAAPNVVPDVGLRAVLDTSAREARSMRQPLIGHVLVYEAEPSALPVSALAWAPAPDTCVLLLGSPLRVIAPPIHTAGVAEISVGRLWRTLRVCSDGEADSQDNMSCPRGDDSVKHELQRPPQATEKLEDKYLKKSPRRRRGPSELGAAERVGPSVPLLLPLRPPQGKKKAVIHGASADLLETVEPREQTVAENGKSSVVVKSASRPLSKRRPALKRGSSEPGSTAKIEPPVQFKLSPGASQRAKTSVADVTVKDEAIAENVDPSLDGECARSNRKEEDVVSMKNNAHNGVASIATSPLRRSTRKPKAKRFIDFDLGSSSDDVKPETASKAARIHKQGYQDSEYDPSPDEIVPVKKLGKRAGSRRPQSGASSDLKSQANEPSKKSRVGRKSRDEDLDYVPSSAEEGPGTNPGMKGMNSGKKSRGKEHDSDFTVSSDEEVVEDLVEDLDMDSSEIVPSPLKSRKISRPSALRSAIAQPVASLSNPVLCASFITVFATDLAGAVILDDNFIAKSADFLLVGTKKDVCIQRWRGACSALGQKRQLSDHWAASIEVSSAVDVHNFPSSKVAIGGPFGEVLVLGMTWNPGDDNSDDLNIVTLWEAPEGVFHGPVNSFSFGLYMRGARCVHLAIAAGNCVAGVRIVDVPPGTTDACTPRKTEVCVQRNAHYHMVSAVCWLPDDSILSASTDGSIFRWRLQWEADKKPCTLISVLQPPSGDKNSVMGVKRSANGLLIVALSSRPKSAGEIGEPAVYIKRKYGSGARSSLLSILAYPGDQKSCGVRVCLEAAIARLCDSSKHGNGCVSLWDVQLWILSDKERRSEAETILCEQLDMLISLAGNSDALAVANRIRKVALCVANLIEQVVESTCPELSKMRFTRAKLRQSLLVSSYVATLKRFVGMAEPNLVQNISVEQREALEEMYSFVLSRCVDLGENFGHEGMVKNIGLQLSELFPSPSTRTLTMCPVCDPALEVPLVADVDEPESFFCASGDHFPRCIMTALPCTDTIPLVCTGCQSQARCTGIDPYLNLEADSKVWDESVLICPLCNCPLLPSSMEAF